MRSQPRILFQETQYIRHPMFWIILLLPSSVVVGTALWIVRTHVMLGQRFGNPPLSDTAVLLIGGGMIAITVVVAGYFALIRLQTEVNDDGLFVRFRPFHRHVRKIDLSGATEVRAVRYRAFLEYGGYFVRKRRMATAYTVAGEDGVRIDFENGFHILIGSARAEALCAALAAVLPGRIKNA